MLLNFNLIQKLEIYNWNFVLDFIYYWVDLLAIRFLSDRWYFRWSLLDALVVKYSANFNLAASHFQQNPSDVRPLKGFKKEILQHLLSCWIIHREADYRRPLSPFNSAVSRQSIDDSMPGENRKRLEVCRFVHARIAPRGCIIFYIHMASDDTHPFNEEYSAKLCPRNCVHEIVRDIV